MNFGNTAAYSYEKGNAFRLSSRADINVNVSEHNYVAQSAIDAIWERVNSIDFTPLCFKLEKEHGWHEEKINAALALYKQWLTLQVLYEDLSFAPSELIDEFWHVHILDTRKYMSDCNSIKGEYIHHYPYFGITEQENEEVLEKGFDLTKKLFKTHFGHSDLGYQADNAASCGCRSGNGSSCR